MKTLIVVNPNAGKQKFKKEIGGITEKLRDSGHEVTVITTESKAKADEVLSSMPGEPELIICAGGDGTLNETISMMIRAGGSVPIGYLPAGTTNDFANSIGIPKKSLDAVERIITGVPKYIDVGKFGDKNFVYVASFGAFTASSYNTTQNLKNSLGYLAYVIEGMKELPKMKSYHVKVTTQNAQYEGNYIFGAVSNALSLGGVIKLNPEQVDFSDGLFEVILVKMPKNIIELSRIVYCLKSGVYDEEFIIFDHVDKVEFACEEHMPWSLDGEYAAGGSHIKVEAIHDVLQMVY